MAQTVAPPPPPKTAAPARPQSKSGVSLPANIAPALVQALENAEAPPPEPKFKPAELAMFLRQTVLLVSAGASVCCAAAARYGDRSWLMAVLCAGIAAIVSGMLGMAIARNFEEHCLEMDRPAK